MPAGDVYQFTMVSIGGGVTWANVLYQQTIDDTGSTNPEMDAYTAFLIHILFSFRDIMSNETEIDCVLQKLLVPMTQPAVVQVSNTTGTVAAQMLPANQAVLLSHRSLPANAGNRGHIFVSGTVETWAENGRIKEANKASFDALQGKLVTPYTTAGHDYKIVHRSKKNGTYADIVTTTVRPIYTKIRNRTQRLCPIS